MGQQFCPCIGQDDNLLTQPPLYVSQKDFVQIQNYQEHLKIIQKFTQTDPIIKKQNIKLMKFHINKNQRGFIFASQSQKKQFGLGFRIAYLAQRLIYYGDFVGGLPYGKGTVKRLQKNNQNQYQITEQFVGQFIEGLANGLGIYKNFRKQFSFNGKWQYKKTPYFHSVPINGILSFWNNKQIQKIQFENYQQKDAIITYKQGDKYFGFVHQQRLCPSGIGKMIYSSGDVYEGQWKIGKINGKGTYQWKSGQMYIGQYLDGLKEGNGILYYKSRDKFIGSWINGKRNGPGKLINESGYLAKQGFWVDDVMNKQQSKDINKILQQQNMPIKDLVSQLESNSKQEKIYQQKIQEHAKG